MKNFYYEFLDKDDHSNELRLINFLIFVEEQNLFRGMIEIHEVNRLYIYIYIE